MVGDGFGGVVAEDYRVRVHREQSVSEHEVNALGVRATFPAGNFAVDSVSPSVCSASERVSTMPLEVTSV